MEKLLYYLLALFVLVSCEYEVHENFVEVQKPADEIQMAYDLNAITNGQAILINKETSLNYSLSAFGKDIKTVKFTMGTKTWNSSDMPANGAIYISPSEFPAGQYTLTSEMFVPTGSGSIADQVDAEGYSSQMSWPVIIDYNMVLPEVVSYRKNEEGFFELNWSEPILSHLQVVSYKINRASLLITNEEFTIGSNETKFVDKRNIGDAVTYDVTMVLRYEGKSDLYWNMGRISALAECQPKIVSSDIEQVLLEWNLPYNCHAFYSIDGATPVIVENEQTVFSVPTKQFGTNSWSGLRAVKYSIAAIDKPNEVILTGVLYTGAIGMYLPDEWQSMWVYNLATNQLYSTFFGNIIKAHTYDTFLQVKSSDNSYYTNEILSSRTSSTIILRCFDDILIFDAQSLSLLRTINANAERIVGITNDDRIVVSNNSRFSYLVYNMNGEELGEIPYIDTYFSDYPLISSDGKYLLFTSGNGINRYRITENYHIVGHNSIPVAADVLQYYCLNPVYPDQLIIPYPDEKRIEIRSCSDLSLVREIRTDDNYYVRSIDPVTGNILISCATKSKVLSAETGNVLFEIPTDPNPVISLQNNILTSNYGYLLNIKDYLKQ